MPLAIRTGSAKLVGEKATVVEQVDATGGRVKIGGEIWSARALDERRCSNPERRSRSPKSRARLRSSTNRSSQWSPLIIIVVVASSCSPRWRGRSGSCLRRAPG
jgi:hypothetical protein